MLKKSIDLATAHGHARAGVLAEVMRLLDASNVSLLSIRSTQSDIEYAYLQLIQEDNEHGFRRFDLNTTGAKHATDSDPVL